MSFPRYGLIRNMPGKRRILRIDGDTVHFSEEGVASRAAHRSRVTFLKDKPQPKPKWVQEPLFKRDAFGVSKSMMPGGAFKPISAMSRTDKDIIRGSASVARQGGKGMYRSAQGVTRNDKSLADGMQQSINRRRLGLKRASEPGSGYVVREAKVRGGRATVAVKTKGAQTIPELGEGSWFGAMPGKTRRNKGLVHLDAAQADNASPAAIKSHEFAHAGVRNPMAAATRKAKDQRKWMGDEARAVAAQPAGTQTNTLYHAAAYQKRSLRKRPVDFKAKFRDKYGQRFDGTPGGADAGLKRFREVYDKIGKA